MRDCIGVRGNMREVGLDELSSSLVQHPDRHGKKQVTKRSVHFEGVDINLQTYLFSAFKESRGQALRVPLEHHFVLKMTHFLGQADPGRTSPPPGCKPPARKPCHMQSAKQIRIEYTLLQSKAGSAHNPR